MYRAICILILSLTTIHAWSKDRQKSPIPSHEMQFVETVELQVENNLWSFGNCVALITTSLSVLDCEDESINKVYKDKECKTCSSHQCIPVSTQKLTNHVVTLGADDSNQVHSHMEKKEEHKGCTRYAHYYLSSHRRFR